jgi:hypothetical protein
MFDMTESDRGNSKTPRNALSQEVLEFFPENVGILGLKKQ